MKKLLKFFLIFTSVVGVLLLSCVIYAVCVTSGYSLDKEKLIDTDYTMEFYDVNGNEISSFSGKNLVSQDDEIPSRVKNAFIAVEDKRFYSHKGIDKKAMFRAAVNNIKSFSFKEGASTISQQLIKNTHLSNEKTIKRKLIELKLTRQLEKEFSKEEILEMYLNTIYFGRNSYGITAAAKNYFDKSVADLSLSEAAALAGTVKAPSSYSPTSNPEKCMARKNIVLKLMLEQGMISQGEHDAAVAEQITVSQGEKTAESFYLEKAKEELDNILKLSPYSVKKCKIYTFFDPVKQELLYNASKGDGGEFTGIILDNKSNGISAYYSVNGDEKRQAGSALKPIAVYAPAIESGRVSECTLLLDEKTDFGGYSPSNYGDKYDGYISVKASLEKSSNVCAVRLLNEVGAKNACEFLAKTGIETVEEDQNLALALGSSLYGVSLKDLTSAYTVFSGNGEFQTPVFIARIELDGQSGYRYFPKKNKIMSDAGAYIMNYMMKGVCENGTAKKLSALGIEIAAKTGTVGNKNGNTDAYSISYSPQYTIGIRLSSGETLMNNKITGGGAPTTKAYGIWKGLDVGPSEKFTDCDDVVKCQLDKISYEKDHILAIADEKTPEKYKTEGYFIKNRLPKDVSTRFSHPILENAELKVNNNNILIKLCQTEYYDFIIYREVDGKKIIVYDSGTSSSKNYEYEEVMAQAEKTYTYSIVPYFSSGDEKILGEEICLGTAKCRKQTDFPDDWWDFDI